MDFYDPETDPMADSNETLKADKGEKSLPALEANMEKLYDNLEAKGKRGWSSFNGMLSTFQKNLPEYLDQTKTKLEQTKQQLELLANGDGTNSEDPAAEGGAKPKIAPKELLKNLSTATNEYLDELDDDLQRIETLGLGYASKFGSFLKEAIKVQLPKDTEFDGDETLDKSEVLFGVPDEGVHSSRAEIQLHELRSSEEIYTKSVENPEEYALFLETYKPFEPQEIESLFTSFSSLKSVHDSLVPSSVTEEDFWKKYRYEQDRIVKEEQRRKLLLERSGKSSHEDFDWDDEEEDPAKDKQPQESTLKDTKETKETPRTSSELSLESASSSTLEVVTSKKSKEDKPAVAIAASEDDDEDDDWE